jgi:hypothetical protein
MDINELFIFEETEVDQALDAAGIDLASTDWIVDDIEFLMLYKRAEAIDEEIVKLYIERGDQSSAWKKAKAQQKAIRRELERYMLRALQLMACKH